MFLQIRLKCVKLQVNDGHCICYTLHMTNGFNLNIISEMKTRDVCLKPQSQKHTKPGKKQNKTKR